MEQRGRRLLAACIALTLLAIAAEPVFGAEEGVQSTPALELWIAAASRAECYLFSKALDSAVERLDLKSIERTRELVVSSVNKELAAAVIALFNQRYSEAQEAGRGAATSRHESIRSRASQVVDLAGAWDNLSRFLVEAPSAGPGVRVWVPAAEEQWGRVASAETSAQVKRLTSLFPSLADTGFSVTFLESWEQLGRATQLDSRQLERSGTVGVTVLNRIFILSPSAFPNGHAWFRVLGHELVHLGIHRTHGRKIPIELEEGLAMALEDWGRTGALRTASEFDSVVWVAGLSRGLITRAWKDSLIMSSSALAARAALLDGLVLVSGLTDCRKQDSLVGLMGSLSEYDSTETAVRALCGIGSEQLRTKFESSIRPGPIPYDLVVGYTSYPEMLGPRAAADLERARRQLEMIDLMRSRGHRLAAWSLTRSLPEVVLASPEGLWRLCQLETEVDGSGGAETGAPMCERFAGYTMSLYPDDSRTLYMTALVKREAGKRDQALELVRRAAAVNPVAREPAAMVKELEGSSLEKPAANGQKDG